ncbi:hypothetical protein B0H16DRAFT_1888446 [Mycena metata]|uniref:F-box domain-containing protein n=1 Tax=Mycena metata TaxID=1033252 RepID=A0AAD7ITJ6_9AGAR|nr:hypothetical protein B0H16DRAFT_1888446 [Mycena metata]
MAAGKFGDLPTEILTHILDDPLVSLDALYSLALLCRRLHLIALSVYFSRHEMTSVSRSLQIQMAENRDLLAVLQMALFLPDVDDLTFIFPHPSCVSISPILRELRRVETYLSRFHSVKGVTLQLDEPHSVCLSVGDEIALRAWSIGLGSLLNCILEKECSCLAVMYGAQMTRYKARNFSGPPRGSRIRRLLETFLCHSTEMPARDEGHIDIQLAPPLPSSRLRSLTIQSATLVIPPGLHWTLALLRNSNITSLTLGRGVEGAAVWSDVLPLIGSATQRLTSLDFLGADFILPLDILGLLSGLPALVHLGISSTQDSGSYPLEGPPTQLPALQTLRAPPGFVRHFVQQPLSLPSIRSICILWSEIFAPIGIRILGTVLSDITQTLHTRGLSPSMSVSCDVTPRMTYSHELLAQYSMGGFPAFLANITALEITMTNVWNVNDLGAWIGLCPRMQRVDITLGPWSGIDLPTVLQVVKSTNFRGEMTLNGEVCNIGAEW